MRFGPFLFFIYFFAQLLHLVDAGAINTLYMVVYTFVSRKKMKNILRVVQKLGDAKEAP